MLISFQSIYINGICITQKCRRPVEHLNGSSKALLLLRIFLLPLNTEMPTQTSENPRNLANEVYCFCGLFTKGTRCNVITTDLLGNQSGGACEEHTLNPEAIKAFLCCKATQVCYIP